MASSDFEFVQGNERLDWGVLVSIDVERLMKSTSVDTLQRIVENIAFSRVTRDEAALFTPEHILHIFQLCQVVIQYLVYSQEALAKMNVRLNDRMAAQQATVQEREAMLQRLSEENSSLKKQVKTQRRTLLAYEYNAQAALARGSDAPASQVYACPYCGETYHKAESMQSHLRKRHNGAVAAAPPVPTSPPAAPVGYDGAGVTTTTVLPSSPLPQASTSYAPPAQILPAEELAALQQLRQRVEQLEKDKEVLERRQREDLILMMLSATRSQQTCAPAISPPQALASTPATPSALPLASASSPLPGLSSAPASPTPNTTNPDSLSYLPDQLQGIPVVPDISAMMNYNLSCQREASENVLRRQLVDLEAEIRSLKANKGATSGTADTTPETTPPTASVQSTGAELAMPSPPSSSSTVPRPPWVAELERAQHSTTRPPPPPSAPAPVIPSLSVPASPPPAPLPPAPPSAATTAASPKHMYDYTTGTIINPPSPTSVPQLPTPLPTVQSPPHLKAPPSRPPTPAAVTETPLSVPDFNTQQQQQVPPPSPSLSNSSLTPVPTVGLLQQQPHLPSPLPTTVPPSPEKNKAPTKVSYWGSDSSSSLSSTSTVPPNRAASRGLEPAAVSSPLSTSVSANTSALSSFLLSAPSVQASTVHHTTAITNNNPPIDRSNVTTLTPPPPSLPAPSTGLYPMPGMSASSATQGGSTGVGSYFANRPAVTAPPLSFSPSLTVPTTGPTVPATVPRPGTGSSTTSTGSNSTNAYLHRNPPPLALSTKTATTFSLSPVSVPQSGGGGHQPSSCPAPTVAPQPLPAPYASPAPALSTGIPVPSLGELAGTGGGGAAPVPVPTPLASVPSVSVSSPANPTSSFNVAVGGGSSGIRPYQRVSSSSSHSSTTSHLSLGGGYEY